MTFQLYASMQAHGTLDEKPEDVPKADKALHSTMNWMRALAIRVRHENINFATATGRYSTAQLQPRINIPPREVNSVAEQMLFSLNRLAALKTMTVAANAADVASAAIVTWYYGIYGAASAMVAACDGTHADTHAKTAIFWGERFPKSGLALPPFDLWIGSLLKTDVAQAVAGAKQVGTFSLQNVPINNEQASGCCAEYLSGTAKWLQWAMEERVRAKSEFKALKVSNFLTKNSQMLRDAEFAKHALGFVHQASRYRGKANYRDAIYLAYGAGITARAQGFANDLCTVLEAFTVMAAAYINRRVGPRLWSEVVADFDNKRAMSITASAIWQ